MVEIVSERGYSAAEVELVDTSCNAEEHTIVIIPTDDTDRREIAASLKNHHKKPRVAQGTSGTTSNGLD